MLRGEVWWGHPTLPGGSRKRRPFLIVSHDAFNRNERYPKVMVVHLTSVRRAGDDYPWEVELAREEVAARLRLGHPRSLSRHIL